MYHSFFILFLLPFLTHYFLVFIELDLSLLSLLRWPHIIFSRVNHVCLLLRVHLPAVLLILLYQCLLLLVYLVILTSAITSLLALLAIQLSLGSE